MSLRFYHRNSFLYISILFAYCSCSKDNHIVTEDNKKLAAQMFNDEQLKHDFNGKYQGTTKAFKILDNIHTLDSTHAEAWRTKSTSYLKRGLPHKWKPLISKAVKYNPKLWQPYRGYLYLMFYRDYKNAIADFDASDTLTPNFIDAPFGQSVDYWRGLSYLGLQDYKNSLAYFNKFIKIETEEWGEDAVEVTGFLYRGIALYESNEFSDALKDFDKVLFYNYNHSADAKYYKALILKNTNPKEAKQLIESAIIDFNTGYFNRRPYVEAIHQIYLEDLETLQNELKQTS